MRIHIVIGKNPNRIHSSVNNRNYSRRSHRVSDCLDTGIFRNRQDNSHMFLVRYIGCRHIQDLVAGNIRNLLDKTHRSLLHYIQRRHTRHHLGIVRSPLGTPGNPPILGRFDRRNEVLHNISHNPAGTLCMSLHPRHRRPNLHIQARLLQRRHYPPTHLLPRNTDS